MAIAVVIVTDNRYAGGMTAVARKCADSVIILAAGSSALADSVSRAGSDKVVLLELEEDIPPEAVADTLASLLTEMSPRFIMSNDAPSARVLLASAAKVLEATVVGDLISAEATEGGFSVTCSVAGGIALQQAEVSGTLAAVYGGGDLDPSTTLAPVETMPANPDAFRVVEEVLPSSNMVDLGAASRIVGVGRGVKAHGDLAEIEELASSLGASMACTLPIHEDSGWYPAEQVLGSSHNSAQPDLYIALGISGSPNHMSGVKDAGMVVAVNSDADAEVFKRCDYGVVADLYDFVPALQEALAE